MAASTAIPVYVEACISESATLNVDSLRGLINEHLCRQASGSLLVDGPLDFSSSQILSDNLERLSIVDSEKRGKLPLTSGVSSSLELSLEVYLYYLSRGGAAEEMVDEEDEGAVTAAHFYDLPCLEFQGIWESLVFDSSLKYDLLDYVTTATLLADRGVDQTIIACNRVVLLHGPPGTGKTSVCKGLAQKLAIRMASRYPSTQLIEVNAHSLFSKWFSESGKLVMKMFMKIREVVEDPNTLVFVLLDEVESLTAARSASGSGTEPSDAIRVVNAVLTQLDQLRAFPNVVVLTTSNITGAIDLAFVDRADFKAYLGPPGAAARYSIFASCIRELRRVGIITASEGGLLEPAAAQLIDLASARVGSSTASSAALWAIASECDSLSGRALRKLPFLALSQAMKAELSLSEFLSYLRLAVTIELGARADLDSGRFVSTSSSSSVPPSSRK